MNNGEKIRIKDLINLGYLYLMKLKTNSNLSRFITSILRFRSVLTLSKVERVNPLVQRLLYYE